MSAAPTAFDRLSGSESVDLAVRDLQVALQAELLRAGSTWEESLSLLREIENHGKPFSSAADALSWYRAPYHPAA